MSLQHRNVGQGAAAPRERIPFAERFSLGALARLTFAAALGAKRQLSRFPPLRRLYYSLRNAQSFDQLFWHDVMLADSVRVNNYARAIEKHIHPGMVVADLGTGSGVLACLAAKRGAKVYAIEHAGIIEKARRLAASNGLTNIEFVHKHSRDFQPKEKIDLLLHEQIGMNLIDEDMVENILELRDRVLKPGATILPGKFSLFIQPVRVREDARLPYIWEQRIGGLDFSSFKPATAPWLAGDGYDKRAVDPQDVIGSLAAEECVLSLDLHSLQSSTFPDTWTYRGIVEKTGLLDGFCLYFHVGFDEEIGFSTGPGFPRTHWGSRLLRCETKELKRGDTIDLWIRAVNVTNASTWTWNYEITSTMPAASQAP